MVSPADFIFHLCSYFVRRVQFGDTMYSCTAKPARSIQENTRSTLRNINEKCCERETAYYSPTKSLHRITTQIKTGIMDETQH